MLIGQLGWGLLGCRLLVNYACWRRVPTELLGHDHIMQIRVDINLSRPRNGLQNESAYSCLHMSLNIVRTFDIWVQGANQFFLWELKLSPPKISYSFEWQGLLAFWVRILWEPPTNFLYQILKQNVSFRTSEQLKLLQFGQVFVPQQIQKWTKVNCLPVEIGIIKLVLK